MKHTLYYVVSVGLPFVWHSGFIWCRWSCCSQVFLAAGQAQLNSARTAKT